jgi:hypothetical protein
MVAPAPASTAVVPSPNAAPGTQPSAADGIAGQHGGHDQREGTQAPAGEETAHGGHGRSGSTPRPRGIRVLGAVAPADRGRPQVQVQRASAAPRAAHEQLSGHIGDHRRQHHGEQRLDGKRPHRSSACRGGYTTIPSAVTVRPPPGSPEPGAAHPAVPGRAVSARTSCGFFVGILKIGRSCPVMIAASPAARPRR